MFRRLALCLFLAASGSAPAVAADDGSLSQWVRTQWTAERGLPQNGVYDLSEDPQGYLWLANEGGLLRFDGLHFVTFDARTTPELAGSVRALEQDGQGGMWIGTAEGLVHRSAEGQWRRYTEADGLAHTRIRSVTVTAEGAVVVASVKGVTRLENGAFTHFGAAEGLQGGGASVVYADGPRVWIGTPLGLQWLEDGRIQRLAGATGPAPSGVDAILRTRDGRLLVGDDRGALWLLDGERWSALPGIPKPSSVLSVSEDPAGTLWVATQESGLLRYRDGVLLDSSGDDDLFRDMLRTVYVDRRGNVWVGTATHGLLRLQPPRLRTWAKEEGLADDLVWVVEEAADGTVWLGTGNGVAEVRDGAVVRTTTSLLGMPLGTVWSLHAQGTTLWIGATGGLFSLQGETAAHYPLKAILGNDVAQSITTDSAGDLWVGSSSGALGRLRGGRFENMTERLKLPVGGPACLRPTPGGGLWICSLGTGLVTLDGERHSLLSTQQGLASNNVTDVHQDERGVLWVASASGLARVEGDRIVNLSVRDGLFDSGIHRVLPDGEGNLWMSSNRGLFRVARAELDRRAAGDPAPVVSLSFGVPDGMKSAECNGSTQPAGTRDAKGRLWFPTIRGVVQVDPARLRPPPAPAAVHLQSAQADGVPISVERGVPPGVRSLELHYAAPDLENAERVTYAYRLEGYDQDWVSAGTRRVAYYTNLDPGEYAFTVRASVPGADGPASAPFVFRMNPAFHQTGWFLALCLIGGTGLVAGIWRARIRYLRARQRELEAHNTQLAAALAAAEEAARLKSEFVANTSHELRTPLNAIVNVPDGVLENFAAAEEAVCGACHSRFELEQGERTLPDACPECGAAGSLSLTQDHRFVGDGRTVVRAMELLRRSSRHLLSVVNDLLDFSRLEAGREVLQLQAVPLGELFADLTETLQPWAKEREVTLRAERPPAEWAVHADPVKVRQILMNLMSNAIKFSNDHGVVELSARPEGPGFVLSVRDHGAGIAPEHHELIFESFRQVDGSHTRKVRGTGLGLSITRKLVELHGGRIWVESALGAGSVFHVSLNAAPSAQENAA